VFRKYSMTGLACAAITLLLSAQAPALTIASLTPASWQDTALVEGTSCYADGSDTITSVPLALRGGTLLRTRSADASSAGLNASFKTDARSEVYVCYDSRAKAPSWASSWLNTGMSVSVSNAAVGNYTVYAKRFDAGTIRLPANEAEAMYLVVVKESLPVLPRKGWVLLSYDMPHLREIIKKAPDYDINMIQISHDIMMNTWEVLEQPTRRADVNEMIDLAHAYGVTEVTLWTHEVCTHGMPDACKAPAGHPAAGRADGNNPAMWAWIQQRYVDLLSPGTGCPEADGITLTFSEVEDNVYMHDPGLPSDAHAEFKHDGFTEAESVMTCINALQQVLAPRGKSLYARTWGSSFDKWEQPIIRDGIGLTNDPKVWMMNKNTGSIDWPHMDTHQPLIGTLPPKFNELIEFDLGFEYFGHSKVTCCMVPCLKSHWNYALERGADGAAARIDRNVGAAYYGPNRLNIRAFSDILANPKADPSAILLNWCRQQFPSEAAQDIADHYDDPATRWKGDTRYMAWEAYFPELCPLDSAKALSIAYAAIARVDKHKEQLERQTTLNTRDGKNDYETLRGGIATAIVKLGGTVPDYPPTGASTNAAAAHIVTQ